MTDISQPMIDMGTEAATGPLEYIVLAIVAGLAATYLARGFLRRRAKAASGEGCTGCPGCGATGTCPSVTTFGIVPGKRKRPD